MTPGLQISDERILKTSATFTITPAPILCEYPHLKPRLIGYVIREVPNNGEDGANQSEQVVNIDRQHSSRSESASSTQQQQQQPDQITVGKLERGKTYGIRLRSEFGNGEFVDSSEVEFHTRPYTGITYTT